MALLMTPSLWDSIDWYHKAPSSIKKGTKITWKEDAYNSLSNTLNRVWAPTPAITRGMDYEKIVCYGKKPLIPPNLTEKFDKAWNMIHAEGGIFQKKTKKFVMYDEKEFVIYGKEDVHFAPTEVLPDIKKLIIDIKTTGNYNGMSSYLSKWQHRIYCWCSRIEDFIFIVYEFDNDTGLLIDIHFIDYHVNNFEVIEKEILDNLDYVIKFLRADPKLKNAYLKKFNY